jgi:murein DD-endopeptidase MepM/ murein hydrolase activator NlpD
VKTSTGAGLAVVAAAALATTHPEGVAGAVDRFHGAAAGRPAHGPARGAPARYACPVAGPVTSGWGSRTLAGRTDFHDGTDLAAPHGSPIYAIAGGTVTFSATADPAGFGQYVDVRLPDGTVIRYGHMSRRLVHAGDQVHAGERIALVGAEGSSTGDHLHVRIYPPEHAPPRHTGRGVNPVPWLRGHGVTLPCSTAGRR